MPGWDLMAGFFAATLVFAAMPGPAILYVTALTAARGRAAGFNAVGGVCAGGFVHVVAAAAGLSAVFAAAPFAYWALKIAGAAYLIWLGLGLLRAAWRGEVVDSAPVSVDVARTRTKSTAAVFRDSAVVEILNPKTALFFIAFLPQFVDPSAAWPVALQFLVLGLIVNAMFSLFDVFAVFAAVALRGALTRSQNAARWTKAFGGSVLTALGVKLALDPR